MPTIASTSISEDSNRDLAPQGPATPGEVAKALDRESYLVVVFAFSRAQERMDEVPLPPPTRFVRGQGTSSPSWTITEKIVHTGSGMAPRGPAYEYLSKNEQT